MKRIPHILICVLTVLVTACSEEVTPTYTVGEANNAITLRAGISQQARAMRTIDGNHGEHGVFNPYMTKAVLRMDGQRSDGWWRRRTTATITDFVDGSNTSKHNKVSMDPMLYWDDFHTADPANTTGRAYGLDIYGAAVANYLNGEGKAGFLPDNTDANGNNLTAMLEKTFDWTALQWTLRLDQSAESFTNCDLLTSNNVTEGKDGTLKFDDVKGKSASNLLEFTHAMTCITVELTAGKGFPKNSKGEAEFTQNPSVTLLGFPYVGIVDVVKKKTTPTKADFTTTTDDPYATGNIESFIRSGGTSHTVTLTALVFPGGSFDDDATNVLKIMADGNAYMVTAKKLNDELRSLNTQGKITTGTTLQQGTNYVFQVTVNKTGVDVTATIKEWNEITAANEAPIINFDKCYGHDGTAFTDPFTLYRSTNKMEGYTGGSDQAVITYENNRYVMTPQLYWPDHKTHYFFRAIWPQVGTPDGPAAITNTNSIEVIEVYNEAYRANKYPSDLRIGMPRKADGTPDETCKNGHGVEGICATDAPDGSTHDDEGKIHLNFQYAMSQVSVKLETNHAASSTNSVTFDEHTKVEILNGYTAGALMLGDGSSYFKGKTPATYTMSKPAADDYTNYLDAIVPQPLTSPAGDLKFRITVGDDAYETVLGIKGIQVNEGGVLKTIDAWKPGKKYVYTLTITKTGVTVTATIADWDTVTADTPIWM